MGQASLRAVLVQFALTSLQNAYIPKVPIRAVVVHAVAHDEHVRHLEPNVCRLDVMGPARGLSSSAQTSTDAAPSSNSRSDSTAHVSPVSTMPSTIRTPYPRSGRAAGAS